MRKYYPAKAKSIGSLCEILRLNIFPKPNAFAACGILRERNTKHCVALKGFPMKPATIVGIVLIVHRHHRLRRRRLQLYAREEGRQSRAAARSSHEQTSTVPIPPILSTHCAGWRHWAGCSGRDGARKELTNPCAGAISIGAHEVDQIFGDIRRNRLRALPARCRRM